MKKLINSSLAKLESNQTIATEPNIRTTMPPRTRIEFSEVEETILFQKVNDCFPVG